MYLAPLTLSLLALPFLAPAPSSGPPTTALADHAAEVLAFPTANAPLEIPAGIGREGYSVWDLMLNYGVATGQHVISNEETLNFLQQARLNLATPMTIPPDQLQTVVESLLVQNDFVMHVVHTGNPRILALTSLNTGARTFVDWTDQGGVRDGGWGWGATSLDYDNDGDVDLTMTNGIDWEALSNDDHFIDDPMRLWRNEHGIFTEENVFVLTNPLPPRSGNVAPLD